jgi:hypothetical protein
MLGTVSTVSMGDWFYFQFNGIRVVFPSRILSFDTRIPKPTKPKFAELRSTIILVVWGKQ